MKLTKEQADYIRNTKSYKTEGFVQKMFARILSKRLKNSSDFKKAVDKADKAADDLRNQIKKAEKAGVKIAPGLKKYAGL